MCFIFLIYLYTGLFSNTIFNMWYYTYNNIDFCFNMYLIFITWNNTNGKLLHTSYTVYNIFVQHFSKDFEANASVFIENLNELNHVKIMTLRTELLHAINSKQIVSIDLNQFYPMLLFYSINLNGVRKHKLYIRH